MNASLLVDGDDLVAAIYAREFERDGEGAQSFSADGSLLFLRVPLFRERSPQTPPLWESGR
jgi:hypothetical protein